jgi:hypothetical protein
MRRTQTRESALDGRMWTKFWMILGAGVATAAKGDVCDCVARKLARISVEYKQSRTLIRILLYILLEWKI